MRIGAGNPQSNGVDQSLVKQPEKAKIESVLLPVDKELPAKKTPAKEPLAENPTEELKKEKQARVDTVLQQLDISNKQMKSEREKQKILMNCLEISRRIIRGDKVPRADHQYLMKHDPGLYSKSILLRVPKDNPRKYKRLSEDDECPDINLQIGPATAPKDSSSVKAETQLGIVVDVNV